MPKIFGWWLLEYLGGSSVNGAVLGSSWRSWEERRVKKRRGYGVEEGKYLIKNFEIRILGGSRGVVVRLGDSG